MNATIPTYELPSIRKKTGKVARGGSFMKYLFHKQDSYIRPTSRIHDIIDDPEALQLTLEQGVERGVIKPAKGDRYKIDAEAAGRIVNIDLGRCLINGFLQANGRGLPMLNLVDKEETIDVAKFGKFLIHYRTRRQSCGFNIRIIVDPLDEVPDELPEFGHFINHCGAEFMIVTDHDINPLGILYQALSHDTYDALVDEIYRHVD